MAGALYQPWLNLLEETCAFIYQATMNYEKYQPCDKLKHFVECYFTWYSVTGPAKGLVIESPPNGFCSMIFNFGDPYLVQSKNNLQVPVSKQFISGQNIYSYKLIFEGNIGIIGIVFKPAALNTIFGLPMFEYVERRVDLYEIFHNETINRIIGQLQMEPDKKEKVRLLESFLLHQYQLNEPDPDFIDQAANFIVEHNGLLQVNDLLKDSFMSRRTFERRFFQKVGLSPKYYARIRRISYLCNLIAGKKKVDWAKLFYECEYYDQAHFIKDFEEFTGRSPSEYLKENTELANFLEKPGTQAL